MNMLSFPILVIKVYTVNTKSNNGLLATESIIQNYKRKNVHSTYHVS